MADSGPRERTLIALNLALRTQPVPRDWAGVCRAAASYGAGLGVTAADLMLIRDLTVEEFAAALLEERRTL